MWGHDPVELFERGGPVMWPLLAASVLAVAVIIERVIVFLYTSGSYRALVRQLEKPVRAKNYDEARSILAKSRSPVARVAETYLEHLDEPAAAREEFVSADASQRLTRLETRLNWLSIIGHLAPMIGLLGTVTGLIDAFHAIELNAGQVQPTDLAQGIWSALLTTVAGLVVALPTLVCHSLLQNRVGMVTLQMQWIVAQLNQWTGKTTAPPKSGEPMPRKSSEARSEAKNDVAVVSS